jgi:hypothetical protein
MATYSQSSNPPLGMGLAAVILGSVGVLLFLLPILGTPLGIVGLAFGVLGFLMAIRGGQAGLRWPVAGIVVSGLALGIGVVIALAPTGYLPKPTPHAVQKHVPYRSYVPPPARPEAWSAWDGLTSGRFGLACSRKPTARNASSGYWPPGTSDLG